MKSNRLKVLTAMSEMEYRSIGEIARIAEMDYLPVRRIVLKLVDDGYAEVKGIVWTKYYRLK